MSSIYSVGYKILLLMDNQDYLPSREPPSMKIKKIMVRVNESLKLKSDFLCYASNLLWPYLATIRIKDFKINGWANSRGRHEMGRIFKKIYLANFHGCSFPFLVKQATFMVRVGSTVVNKKNS